MDRTKKLEKLLMAISHQKLPNNAKEYHDLDNIFQEILLEGSDSDVTTSLDLIDKYFDITEQVEYKKAA